MKKVIFFGIVLLMASCTEQDAILIEQSDDPSKEQGDAVISLDEAVDISNHLMAKMDGSRANCQQVATVDYVVRRQSRANDCATDTLAYILNYADGNGFAIISAHSTPSPVLAFSNDGNFDLSNEVAKEVFVDRIESYMESPMFLPGDKPVLPFEPTPFGVAPFSKMKLSQGAPWNRYVAEEQTTWAMPVGCVAVASAISMAYSKPELTYHDVTYNFNSIVKTLEDKAEGLPVDEQLYKLTCDSMAKILYWIGKDTKMKYALSGSKTTSVQMERLLQKYGYDISSSSRYDAKSVRDSLDNNYVVYLQGRKEVDNEVKHHAFIADGYTYLQVENDPPVITNYGEMITLAPFLHIDWGWGGWCNGYFNGDVFDSDNVGFEPTRYRTIKREY